MKLSAHSIRKRELEPRQRGVYPNQQTPRGTGTWGLFRAWGPVRACGGSSEKAHGTNWKPGHHGFYLVQVGDDS